MVSYILLIFLFVAQVARVGVKAKPIWQFAQKIENLCMWLCCNRKKIKLDKSFELAKATCGFYLHILAWTKANSKLIHLFKF
jgi:hypothetical protein